MPKFIDYGILNSIKNLLLHQEIGLPQGLNEDHVFVMAPYSGFCPAVCIELEETWSLADQSLNDIQACVAFNITTFADDITGDEALNIARQISQILDKAILPLCDKKEALLKLKSTIVDLRKMSGPRKVEQFYEAAIRKAWITAESK